MTKRYDEEIVIDALFNDDRSDRSPEPRATKQSSRRDRPRNEDPLDFGWMHKLMLAMAFCLLFGWFFDGVEAGFTTLQLLVSPKIIASILFGLYLMDSFYPSARNWTKDPGWIPAIAMIMAMVYLWSMPTPHLKDIPDPVVPENQPPQEEVVPSGEPFIEPAPVQ